MSLPSFVPKEVSVQLFASGREARFRQILVRDQDLIRQYKEAGDNKAERDRVLIALCNACALDDVDGGTLPDFDLHLAILAIVKISIGEIIPCNATCPRCEFKHEEEIHLGLAALSNREALDTRIEVSTGVFCTFRFMTVSEDGEVFKPREWFARCLTGIEVGEIKYDAASYSESDINNFYDGFTIGQATSIFERLLDCPYVEYEEEYVCRNCGEPFDLSINGSNLVDFALQYV